LACDRDPLLVFVQEFLPVLIPSSSLSYPKNSVKPSNLQANCSRDKGADCLYRSSSEARNRGGDESARKPSERSILAPPADSIFATIQNTVRDNSVLTAEILAAGIAVSGESKYHRALQAVSLTWSPEEQ
jgi:hypothetical protein